jgi:hypothetical protein
LSHSGVLLASRAVESDLDNYEEDEEMDEEGTENN